MASTVGQDEAARRQNKLLTTKNVYAATISAVHGARVLRVKVAPPTPPELLRFRGLSAPESLVLCRLSS